MEKKNYTINPAEGLKIIIVFAGMLLLNKKFSRYRKGFKKYHHQRKKSTSIIASSAVAMSMHGLQMTLNFLIPRKKLKIKYAHTQMKVSCSTWYQLTI